MLLGSIELGFFIHWSVDHTYLHVLNECKPSLSPCSASKSFLCEFWALFLLRGLGLKPCLNHYSGFFEVYFRVNEFKRYF